jgi:DNA helicase HerA-like ATPase
MEMRTQEQALDEIRRLVPILGKDKATKLETAYLLWDENGRKRILDIVDAIKASVFSDKDLKESILMEPPPKEITINGDFQLGSVLYGKKQLYPLFLNKSDLLTHIGIFGSSGSGKTNIVYSLVKELAKLQIPVLIFDFSKRNYRDLLSITGLKDKIKIYTVGRNVLPFRFNPLKPPEGVQVSQWAKEFSEVFDHAYWLRGGGRYIILKALEDLYKKYSPSYPKIFDLKVWLDRYQPTVTSARERNWIATAERPLTSLTFQETVKKEYYRQNSLEVVT